MYPETSVRARIATDVINAKMATKWDPLRRVHRLRQRRILASFQALIDRAVAPESRNLARAVTDIREDLVGMGTERR